nr:SLC13 family permease [Pectobacterium colocasium]
MPRINLGNGSDEESHANRRPKMFWPNFILTTLLLVFLVIGLLPIQVLFMLGFAIAVMLNYPKLEEQKARIGSHAANVLAVTSLIFAAGIFTGILSGTGMVDAMAKSLLQVIPESFGPYLAVFTALISLPFTFLMSNDAFYFGILPVIAQTAVNYGITQRRLPGRRLSASRSTCSARWYRHSTCLSVWQKWTSAIINALPSNGRFLSACRCWSVVLSSARFRSITSNSGLLRPSRSMLCRQANHADQNITPP